MKDEPTTVKARRYVDCPFCDYEMVPEHAHYRCPNCGFRDTCCEGAPL